MARAERHTRRGLVGVFASALLAAGFFTWPGWNAAALAAASCPTMQLIGVRGSGEHSGYGPTIQSVVNHVTRLNSAVSSEWVDYPAIAVHWWSPHYFNAAYPDSVNQGKTALLVKIRAFLATECAKSTYIYLAGYSQGAQVVGDVYQHSLSSTEKKRVAAVVLFGDPRFASANVAVGNFDSSRYGILIDGPSHTSYGKRTVARPEYSALRTYCQLHDPVCNYTRPDAAVAKAPSSAHLHYADRTYAGLGTYTKIAADFLIGRWRRLGPGSVCVAGTSGDLVYVTDLRTSGTDCATARRIAKRVHSDHPTLTPEGYRCDRRFEGTGSRYTCRLGTRKISWLFVPAE